MAKCRSCGRESRTFLSLGKSPLANNLLAEEDLGKKEPMFPLELQFCRECKLVQLGYVVNPELLFSHYLYVTSTTETFRQHFTRMAEDIAREFRLGRGSVAVDIGSNDGLLLKGFQKFGVRVVGVEPAANIAKIAEKEGVETINDFFSEDVVRKIVASKGRADVVTANNVFAHIEDIHSVTENVKKLMKDDGIFVIEVAYIADMLRDMTFDAVYHEHLYYYSATSMRNFFRLHGMDVFRIMRVDSHGGSLRVFACNKGKKHIDSSVAEFLENERKLGLTSAETYEKFAERVYLTKKKLLDFLGKLRGKSVVGYGSPAKATTLLNFLGWKHLEYIVDDNPLKQGRYLPGLRVAIKSSASLDEKTPDYILILAWNFASEIIAKNRKHAEKGARFIIPLPEPWVA